MRIDEVSEIDLELVEESSTLPTMTEVEKALYILAQRILEEDKLTCRFTKKGQLLVYGKKE